MWWASAGEKRHSDEVDEQSRDAALLADLAGPRPGPVSPVVGHRRGSFASSSAAAAGGGGGGSGNGVVSSLASLAAARGTTAASAGHDGNYDVDEAEEEEQEETQARIELAVVAYFHRLTCGVMSVLADIVDSSDDDDLLGLDLDSAAEGAFDGPALLSGDEEEEARLLGAPAGTGHSGDGGERRGWVRVDSEALAEMGLDVWSQADADFVREVAVRYFGRRAYVETKGVEVCGVRVC
jgi:hypothetical protein